MDEWLLLWINQDWAHPLLDDFFWWVSRRPWFAFPLAAILLYDSIRRRGRTGAWLFLLLAATVGVGNILGDLLKLLFAQPRPCQAVFELLRDSSGPLAGPCGSEPNGMPSNHTLNFVAAVTFVTLATPWRGWKIALFIAAVLVSLSRIYLGKHYPSQILVGAIVGVTVGWLGAWLAMRYQVALGLSPAREAPADPPPNTNRDVHDST